MSTKVKEVVVEFAIVKKVMALLGLDDAGKVNKFFSYLKKQDERAIAQLEANKKSDKLQYDIDVEDLEAQIEDAADAVEAAYLNVKPEDVQTNADIEGFSSTYWYNVQQAESRLESLKKRLENKQEAFKKSNEELDEQIKKYKTRIDKITK